MGKRENLQVLQETKQEREGTAVLEQLFSLLIPEKTAKALVGKLKIRFGGFQGILSAPGEELEEAGVPAICRRLLELTGVLAKTMLEEDSKGLKRVYDTASAIALMRPHYFGKSSEALGVLVLDAKGQALFCDLISEGSATAVPVYIRRLVEVCIRCNASSVYLFHNHPSGAALPSKNDILSTRRVEIALRSIDVYLQDHVILAGEDSYSFLKSGLMDALREEAGKAIAEELEEAKKTEEQFRQERG